MKKTGVREKLYSVSQAIAPYTYHQLVGHNMSYAAARDMSSLIKLGLVQVFPSADVPSTAKLGDNVKAYLA